MFIDCKQSTLLELDPSLTVKTLLDMQVLSAMICFSLEQGAAESNHFRYSITKSAVFKIFEN
jgi:hypothetical protein